MKQIVNIYIHKNRNLWINISICAIIERVMLRDLEGSKRFPRYLSYPVQGDESVEPPYLPVLPLSQIFRCN